MAEKRELSETGQRMEESLSLASAALYRQRQQAIEHLKNGVSTYKDFSQAIGDLLDENLKATEKLEKALYELRTGRKWGGKRE